MHMWGDKDVDWAGIDAAASFIGDFCRRWGRISVTSTKEKYGTVRVYCHFGVSQLSWLFYPGYVYSPLPKWLWNIDCMIFRKLFEPFQRPIVWWQKIIYRAAYRKALKKWPHLFEEITSCMDYREFLPEADLYWTAKNKGYDVGYKFGVELVLECADDIACCPGGAKVLRKRMEKL